MKLKFLSISIENFLSLGNVELKLNDMGYTLITGINNDPNDNATSNGVGKSSIFDALTWCLTGKTIRGTDKNITNIHTEGGTGVELTFLMDGKEYRVCRYKDHKKHGTTLHIFINGEDKSGKGIRDGEKLLSEYLPDLTLQFIGSVIVFGQGLPQRFTNNTPSGRKEVLERLSQSDFMIEDIKKRLADRKVVLNTELRKVEDSILSLNSKVQVIETNKDRDKKELDSLEDENQLLSTIEEASKKVEALLGPLEESKSLLNDLEQQLNEKVNVKSSESYSYSTHQLQLSNKYNELSKELVSTEAQLSGQIRALVAEISNLKNVRDVCPTCGQKLPNVHKVDTTEKEKELQALQDQLVDVRSKLSTIKDQRVKEEAEIKKNYECILLKIDNEINEIRQSVQSCKSKIASLEEEKKYQEDIYNSAKSKYSTYKQHKQYLVDSISNANQEITRISQQIGYNTVERDELKSRLDVVSKMITIATRDFRGFLLLNVINYIQERAKVYSKDIFGTDKIEFNLNGNNIDISYNGKVYENLSGGESQKVNIIINLAIRDMLCQFSNFSSNILVLDEIFDNLDITGCSQIINVITKRLVNIESVFIITHRAELMVPVDSTINLIKNEDGVTNLC